MLDPSALDPSVRYLAPSATLAINELSADLQREGRDIVRFGLGQSPFPVPGVVVEALRRHAHQKDYLPVQGLLPLRQAVARFHARRDGLSGRDAAHVMVGPGSKELLFLLQLVYDAELLLPNPSWVSYAPQAGLAGRSVRWLETHGEQDWQLKPDILEAACDGGSRARVLLLNSPSNPTGRSHDESALKALADVCRRHQVLVLSDEIYGELHHTGEHVSIARFYPEGTIVSAGLSKWCGAGGWRLGTFSFPPELDFLLRAMCAVASESFTSVSAPIQHAAIVAFELSEEVLSYLERSRRVLRAVGGWCRERLVAGGAHCTVPDGGFYLMPNLGPLAPSLRARGIDGSEVLAQRLLEDTGVALLPGTAFGRPSSELSVRMAYVDFDGRAALDSVSDSMDEDWLHAHCPRVVKGIERWVSWMSDSEPP
jgi:aspartate aminotransferase